MTSEEAAQHICRARTAQRSWGATSVQERTRALRQLRSEIAGRIDSIVQTISAETGKTAMDALSGDAMVTLEQLKANEEMAAKFLRTVSVRKPPFLFGGCRFREQPEAYGVVLVLAPWNYPLQLAVIPMATALLAGNAVVLKCSEYVPRTSALIHDICQGSGLPTNLIQVLSTPAGESSALIDGGPDLIFFTGSTDGGRAVMERAAKRIIPVMLELGGKDAALVFESCDLRRTAAGVCYAAFANAGQVCVSAKRIYLHRAIAKPFLELFLDELKQLRCGTSSDSDYGSLRLPGVEERLRAQVNDALSRGARLHSGGWDGDVFTGPIVLSAVPEAASLLREDSFGPVVCLDVFDSEHDAIRMANASSFALSASIWTGDRRQAERVAAALECGSCCVNDAIRHVGNPYASFGGNKASGFGRYRGVEGLHAFSRKKTVMYSKGKRREVHWFPTKRTVVNQLAFLMRARHSRGRKRFSLRSILTLLPVLLVCSAGLAQEAAGSLTLAVRLPAGVRGELRYLLFASPTGFPDHRDDAVRHGFVELSTGPTTQTIKVGAVPPGRYAVTVYLDENGNRKLDKNWIGIPKEPVGASNNPRPHLGGPRFDECAFTHPADAQTVSITLRECCKP